MRYLLLLLWLLSSTLVHAQSPRLDSLQQRLEQLPADTSRVNGLLELSLAHWRAGYDSLARVSINRAIRLAKQVNYPFGEARARIYLARIEADYLSDTQMAHAHLDTADLLAKQLNDLSLQGQVLFRRAQLYENTMSLVPRVVPLLQEALRLFRQAGDRKAEASIYNELALMKTGEGHYAEVIDWLLKARRLQEAVKDVSGLKSTLPNLGIAYLKLNRRQEALASFAEAERIARQQHDDVIVAFITGQRASLLEAAGQYSQALQRYLEQATLYQTRHTNSQLPRVYVNIGRMYLHLKNYPEALRYSQLAQDTYRANVEKTQEALEHGAQINFGKIYLALQQYHQVVAYARVGLEWTEGVLEMRPERTEYNRQLAEAYEHLGQPAKALQHFRRYKADADSTLNEEAIRKATELTMNYGFEKKQQVALADQQKKEAVAQTRQSALLVGLGMTLVLAAVALYAFRNKRRANILLSRQKEEVQQTLAKLVSTQQQLIQKEKMASLGELTAGIAHEIQNPLNFVNNFAEVSAELAEELTHEIVADRKEDALSLAGDLTRNLFKIHHHGQRADSIVKRMLQHSRTSSHEKQPTDLNGLAEEYLRHAYHGMRTKDKDFTANLVTDFDSSIGQVETLPQEIGRVLLNLYNNAFYAIQQKKRQLNGSYQPELKVRTRKVGSQVEIRVKDNGTGIPEAVMQKIFQPFFTTKPTGEGTGLGLSLSYEVMTKGLGGELRVESEEGMYSEFIVVVPAKPL